MSEREDLFRDIQTVLAGHSDTVVVDAILSALLVAIGVAAPDLENAEALIDGMPAKLKPMLRQGWGSYRLHRARMSDQDSQATH